MAETSGKLTPTSFTIMLGLTAHGIKTHFPGKAKYLVCAYVLLAVNCALLCVLCEAKRDL